jgi:hypothetical protein
MPRPGETIAARKLSEQDAKKRPWTRSFLKDYPFSGREVTREEAERRIKTMDEPSARNLESIKTEPLPSTTSRPVVGSAQVPR